MDPDANQIDLWAEGQRRFAALGRTLDDGAAETIVPACPDWTVRDVFAHQAGAASDLLAGRLEGVATDPWTARQVAERSDRSLTEILDEWDADAPTLVEALRPMADDVDPRLLFDQWTHDQDVRGAVDQPGARDDGRAQRMIRAMVGGFARRVGKAGLDPVVIDLGRGDTPAGDLVVTVDPFELARAGVGRRSPAQMRAWGWPMADPDPYVDLISAFPPRTTDLVEPA